MEVSFPSIDAAPSWYAITQNGIICLATFGCAVLWFLLSGNGKKRITDADSSAGPSDLRPSAGTAFACSDIGRGLPLSGLVAS